MSEVGLGVAVGATGVDAAGTVAVICSGSTSSPPDGSQAASSNAESSSNRAILVAGMVMAVGSFGQISLVTDVNTVKRIFGEGGKAPSML